jgi:hypothetical protein
VEKTHFTVRQDRKRGKPESGEQNDPELHGVSNRSILNAKNKSLDFSDDSPQLLLLLEPFSNISGVDSEVYQETSMEHITTDPLGRSAVTVSEVLEFSSKSRAILRP